MKKKIAVIIICAVLLVSCGTEPVPAIGEPAENDEYITPSYDDVPPPEENDDLDEPDEFPSEEGWQAEPDGVVDEPEPEPEAGLNPTIINELVGIVDNFTYALIPLNSASIPDAIHEALAEAMIMTLFYRDYYEAGLIEPVQETKDFFLRDDEYGYVKLKIENLDYIYNDIFAKNAENILPFYNTNEIEDGLIETYTWKTRDSTQRLVFTGYNIIDNDIIGLFFYFVYDDFGVLYRSREGYEDDDGEPVYTDTEVVGTRDGDNWLFYEDLLDTLRVVRYTFIREDGKYKIQSINYTNY